MLLDELLIKIGIDADSQAMQQFEQFLNVIGEGTEGAAESLGAFAQSIEEAVGVATEEFKATPEFAEFIDSIEKLNEETDKLSQDEAIDAWVQKLVEGDEFLSAFGQGFLENTEELAQELEKAGLNAEQVDEVLSKLKNAIEQKQIATDKDTQSVEKNTQVVEKNTESAKENAESTEELTDKVFALWASNYGADSLIQKFEFLGVSINKTTLKIAAFGAAFYAATIGVKNFVDHNLDALDEIKQLSAITGEAADHIYNLGKVAEVNGSSAQAAQASIEGLSRVIGEAATGVGRGAKSFEQYGLSAKKANGEVKSSNEVLGEIADKMKKMGEQEQIAMLAKLGIDGSMIQVLRLGNDELREQIELADKLTLGVGNAENAETAAAFKDALTQVSQVLTAIGEYLSLRIAPSIQRLAERFTKWFTENNEFVKSVLNGFGKVLSFLFELAGAVDNVVESTVGWKTVIIALGGLLLWLSRRMILAFATNPIGQAIIAITAIILLLDDFITYLQGGETAFGDMWEPCVAGAKVVIDWIDRVKIWFANFLKGWEKSGASIQPLIKALLVIWAALWNIIGVFKRLIIQIFGATDATDDLASQGQSTGELLGKIFTFVSEVIEGISTVTAFVATEIGASFEMAGSVVIGVFKAIWALWEALVEGFTSGNWLDAFEKMFAKLGNIMNDVWHNIKVAAIEFVNGLINIINKFGEGIDPIEIPIRQTIETVGSTTQGLAGFAEKIGSANVGMYASASQSAANGVSNTSTTSADNSVKNSNNKYQTTINIQSTGDPKKDGKQAADAFARTVANNQSAIVG